MRFSCYNKSAVWLPLCLVGLVVSACDPFPTEGGAFRADACLDGETFCRDPVAIEVIPTHVTLTAGRVDTVGVRVRWPSGRWYTQVSATWEIRDTTTVTLTGCDSYGWVPCINTGSSISAPAVEITALKAGETWLVGQFRLLSASALVVVTPAM